jgi:hypothetical protein
MQRYWLIRQCGNAMWGLNRPRWDPCGQPQTGCRDHGIPIDSVHAERDPVRGALGHCAATLLGHHGSMLRGPIRRGGDPIVRGVGIGLLLRKAESASSTGATSSAAAEDQNEFAGGTAARM